MIPKMPLLEVVPWSMYVSSVLRNEDDERLEAGDESEGPLRAQGMPRGYRSDTSGELFRPEGSVPSARLQAFAGY